MKNLLKLLPFFFVFVGCDEEKTEALDGTVFSESYIQVFVITDDVKFEYEKETEAIKVSFEGEEIANHAQTTNYGRPAQDLFNDFCNKFGDTGYNRNVVRFTYWAVVDEFSIEVTCNEDFNGIPAGASLNEITGLIGTSAYGYVKSKYVDVFNWEDAQMFDKYTLLGRHQGFHPVKKLLSELEPSDMTLLNNFAYLKFNEIPSSGEYVFTINFSSKDKEISKDISIKFE